MFNEHRDILIVSDWNRRYSDTRAGFAGLFYQKVYNIQKVEKQLVITE